MTGPIKPPFAYFGGKTLTAGRIAELLPPHHLHYVEPYGGSLAVLLAKRPARMETVNDLDHNLMTFWRILRDRPDDLARVCALTPHSRAEYKASGDRDAAEGLEVARLVWCQLAQGRSGTLRPSKTGWRRLVAPRSSGSSMPGYLEAYVERMAAAAERLHAVSLECLPALDLIATYGRDSDVLLYVDPPYLGSTRGWGNNYWHEMKTEADHRELAAALRGCAASVVVTGYPSDLYDRDLYAGWDRVTVATITGNGRDGAKARPEVLWSNRPLGSQLALDLSGVTR